MKTTATEAANICKSVTFEFTNPKSKNITEVIIYHYLQKITITTQDKMNFYLYKKLPLCLDEIQKTMDKDISYYTIQTLKL
jgi:hypothetical protein